ncbi:unnamed protein product [Pleuronectes platessa]|uniref:Uncharacterized protein n=1 Tax=Pleuronectes platessa TaxID=8262 RepID=A0A9N7W1S3_PLEPL|nr:unnamed protein product [Pleuronectes platessa]
MTDDHPDLDLFRKEMEALNFIPSLVDLDLLMEVLNEDMADSFLPPNETPAEELFGPQEPQTEFHMPLGAALDSLQQPFMPAPGLHTANTNPPLPPPYYAPAEEEVGPQQPQTECYMPLGAPPCSLQQPVMPAPGWATPMYQPLQPHYMYSQAAPFSYSQVNTVPIIPYGLLNGGFVYGVPAYTALPVASDAPEVKAHAPQKKKLDKKQATRAG